MKTSRDEPLEEIWEIRRQIAKELGDQPENWVAHYQQKQREIGGRIYQRKTESTRYAYLKEEPEEM